MILIKGQNVILLNKIAKICVCIYTHTIFFNKNFFRGGGVGGGAGAIVNVCLRPAH